MTDEKNSKTLKLTQICEKIVGNYKEYDNDQSKIFFENNFTPYLVANDDQKGLLTAYYEPILSGSLKKNSI